MVLYHDGKQNELLNVCDNKEFDALEKAMKFELSFD